MIQFFYNLDQKGVPSSLFSPDNEVEDSYFFWLGDGFVNKDINSSIYIFAYHVKWTGDNVFDFIEPDVSIIKLKNNSHSLFNDYKILSTPLHVIHSSWGYVNFGAGIFVNTEWSGSPEPDGNIYVYGCMDEEAFNYDSSANTNQVSGEDSSDPCIAVIEGCTNPAAFNYN